MNEVDFLKRIAELEADNQELQADNKRLRKMLSLPEKEIVQKEEATFVHNTIEEKYTSDTSVSINKYSFPEEKIELFLSLFRGRTDVYAKRCYSKKHGSSYYIPACKKTNG